MTTRKIVSVTDSEIAGRYMVVLDCGCFVHVKEAKCPRSSPRIGVGKDWQCLRCEGIS